MADLQLEPNEDSLVYRTVTIGGIEFVSVTDILDALEKVADARPQYAPVVLTVREMFAEALTP